MNNNNITPDYVARFIETTEKQFSQMEKYIKELEEKLSIMDLRMETNKLLISEKNENTLFRLNTLQDKVISSEQKVNELNSVMLKHFAYKSKLTTQPSVPSHVQQSSVHAPSQPIPIPQPSQPFIFK